MIFKVVENEEDGQLVEFIHVHNVSKEVLGILKTTKQPTVPYLYQKVFDEVLLNMPEDVQYKVRALVDSYNQDDVEIKSEDINTNFEHIVKILQHIMSLYKRVTKLQDGAKLVEGYIKASSNDNDLLKISRYLKDLLLKSHTLISDDMKKLKKEYSSVKLYAQSVYDKSIYHETYTAVFNEKFFFDTLAEDISSVQSETGLFHGLFAIKLNKEFIDKLTSSTQETTKNYFDIELNLIQKSLSISILNFLRKMDYVGILGDDTFVVVFQNTTQDLFESFINNMVIALKKTSMFTQSNYVSFDLASMYLDVSSSNIIEIKNTIKELIKKSSLSDSEKYTTVSMNEYFA